LGDAYPAQMLLLGSAGSQLSIGFSLVTEGDASLRQDAVHQHSRYTESSGKGVLGFAGFIGGDGLLGEGEGVPSRPSTSRRRQAPLPEPGSSWTEEPASLERIRETLFGHVKLAGKVLDASARNVELDRVLQVGVRRFLGQVYNLQNQAQWYSADGIITHNCFAEPVVEGIPSPFGQSGLAWFEAQPQEVQRSIMGDAHYHAWRVGEFELKDAARMHSHPVWGEQPQVVPLRQLVRSRGAGYAVAAG